jgi:hypothetical protein
MKQRKLRVAVLGDNAASATLVDERRRRHVTLVQPSLLAPSEPVDLLVLFSPEDLSVASTLHAPSVVLACCPSPLTSLTLVKQMGGKGIVAETEWWSWGQSEVMVGVHPLEQSARAMEVLHRVFSGRLILCENLIAAALAWRTPFASLVSVDLFAPSALAVMQHALRGERDLVRSALGFRVHPEDGSPPELHRGEPTNLMYCLGER